MKALVWTMLVLFAALLPVEILADGRSSLSAAPIDRVQRFPQYRGPLPRPVNPRSDAVSPAGQSAPTIKCGLTMIPGDPMIDPGIRRPQPRGSARFTIRAVQPTLCR